MRMLRFLLIALTLTGLTVAYATRAATPNAGDLIKISTQPDVYYYGANGKRYVFPNEKTFFSWYSSFDTKTLTNEEIAAIPVGGAVTYKPGVKMVKITTDPKVYAVAQGGVLRWIKTEAVASELYGADWNTKVHDLPDEFFATYKTGADVEKATDFSPAGQGASADTINKDKGLDAVATSTPSVPTPTSTASGVTLSVSKSPALAGDVILLTAVATDASGISKIEIYFDGTLVTTCLSSSCSAETQIPISGTKSVYEAKAIATAQNASQHTKLVSLPIDATASGLVKLAVNRTMIKKTQLLEAIVNIDPAINTIRTDIYANNIIERSCASSIRECRWSELPEGGIGTVYDIYAKVTDTLGRLYYSPHKTITVAANDSPIITILEEKSLIYKGESVNVTVSAEDDDTIVKIEVLKGEEVVKTCQNAANCTVTSGPWNEAGSLSFSGRAVDALGATSTSDTVTVTVK